METINIKLLSKKISKMITDREWDQFHSVKNLSMALAVEASELLEIFQWLTEAQSNAVKDDRKAMEKIEDEVADIFIYLLRIVHKTGVDLEKSVVKKLKKNELKYPVKLAKGIAKKYTDF